MTVHFSNPGEIDPRLITTLGVNVKDTEHPIGFFGTGFKYAIAVLLREGQFVQIFAGLDVFNFEVMKDSIRGKEFDFIVMRKNGDAPQTLGFTTSLGRNWGLQHAYRELFSNMRDEGGDYTSGHPGSGHTTVRVQGEKFDQVHKERGSFLLGTDRICLEKGEKVEIYAGRGDQVFYRGIAAYKLAHSSLYTYNIVSEMRLTEDRTIASLWEMSHDIRNTISQSTNRTILGDCLTAPENAYERGLDYDWSNNRPSQEFKEVLRSKIKERLGSVVPTAQVFYFKGQTDEKVEYDDRALNAAEEAYLQEQIEFCARIGFPMTRQMVRVVQSLGEDIEGMAQDGEILLAYRTFGSYVVRETLIEEFIHIVHKVSDYTRQMQNVLFSHIVRMGEQMIAAKAVPLVITLPPARPASERILDDEVPF